MALSPEERFWGKVHVVPGACWEWTGAKHHSGHGAFWSGGTRRVGRVIRAHRFSYELHNGPIPPGKHVLHECDNPACVNPGHLELGDHAKNMRDAATRGRIRRGAEHGMARLTPALVREIRRLRARGAPYRAIGERLGIPWSTARSIGNGSNWGWLR